MSRILIAAALFVVTQALAFDGGPARATVGVAPDATFHRPKITEAAFLRRRLQVKDDATYVIAPDNTCGYIDEQSLTCRDDFTCAVKLQEDSSVAGCITYYTDFEFVTDCYNYNQYESYCGSSCISNSRITKCSDVSTPYCLTISFFDGAQNLQCVTDTDAFEVLSTTYDGQTDALTWDTYTAPATSSSIFASTSTEEETTTETPTITTVTPIETTETSEHPPSTTEVEDLPPSFPTSTQTTTSNTLPTDGSGNGRGGDNSGPIPPKKSSTPVAPIAGGVVGGVGALAFLGLGSFFLIKRHNKNKNGGGGGGGFEQPMQQTPPAPLPGGGGSGDGGGGGAAELSAPIYQAYDQPLTPPPQAYSATSDMKHNELVGSTPVPPPAEAPVPTSFNSPSPVYTTLDHRYSALPQGPVYEASGNPVGEPDYNSNHRGQFHEM
ncbi:hypothetical protein F4808DRAFT_458451 [Astrocystis sublimbata]|nr:hypothetical protein F4808DRAFT_458451 [Astrocystis sublimbata]